MANTLLKIATEYLNWIKVVRKMKIMNNKNENSTELWKAGDYLIRMSKKMRLKIFLSFCLLLLNSISSYIIIHNLGQTHYFGDMNHPESALSSTDTINSLMVITILADFIFVIVMIFMEFAIIENLQKAGEELKKC